MNRAEPWSALGEKRPRSRKFGPFPRGGAGSLKKWTFLIIVQIIGML